MSDHPFPQFTLSHQTTSGTFPKTLATMKKSLLLSSAITLTALLPVTAQEDQKALEQLRAERERLVKIVTDLEADFGATLKDFGTLQQDYGKLLKATRVPDLSGKVRELQKKLKTSTAELAALRQSGKKQSAESATRTAKLQSDLTKLQGELHEERQALLIAKTELSHFKKLEKEAASLRKSLSNESLDRAQTLGRLQAVRGERDALLGRLKEANDKAAAAEKDHREAVARIEQLKNETSTLKEKLGKSEDEIARLRSANASGQRAQKTIDGLKKEKESLIAKLDAREKELGGLRSDLATEQSRSLDVPVLLKARKDLENRLAARSGELKKAKDELAAQLKIAAEVPYLKKTNADLLEKQANLDKDIEAAKAKIGNMQKALDANRDALAKAEALGQKVPVLTAERTKLSKQLADAKTGLRASEAALAASKKEAAEAVAIAATVPELKKQNADLLKKQSAQQARIEKVTASIDQLQKDLAKNKEAAATAKKLGQEVTSLKAKEEILQKDLAEATQELTKARENLTTTQTALEASRAKAMETAMAANNAKMELHEANKELTIAKDALQNVQEKITELQKQAAQAQALKKANATLLNKQKTLTADLAKNTAAMQAAVKLGQDKKALQAERDQLQKNLAAAEKELSQMATSNASYQTAIDSLTASLESLKSEKQNLTRQVSLRGVDIANLRKEIQEKPDRSAEVAKLTAELSKARTELGQLHLNSAVMEKKIGKLKQRVATIDPIRYAKGAANVAAQQDRVLSQVREVLNFFPEAKFEIVGHTCDLGSKEGNLKLSQERAQALRKFLVSRGLQADRLTSRGVADAEPVAPNTNETNRARNRRVEVQILD